MRHTSLITTCTCVAQEIKFGDASPVVCDLRDKIVFDEFEFDQTSVRRTESVAMHRYMHCIHSPSQIHSWAVSWAFIRYPM